MFDDFIKYVGKNFGSPQGIGGIIAAKIMNIINQKQYNAIIQSVHLEPNNTVLDIGFGNGYVIKKLLKKNIPITIYGIEISGDMLNGATQNLQPAINKGTVKLSLENIQKTSFEQNVFDKIYTVNTIYFWNNLEKCFSEIKRILKPNGIFVNAVYTKEFMDKIMYTKYGFNKYTITELEAVTKKQGMQIIQTIEIKHNTSYCVVSKNIK
jgi:ubiquinone/menaquinone biosynthesis C-methylase UbiE